MKEALHRTWSLVIKELLQLSRDRLLLVFVLLAPLVELVLMGGLTGGGIENLPLAVVDLDRSRASRELATSLEQTDEMLIRYFGASTVDAQELMQKGEISVIVVVPPGYGEQLTDPQLGAEVQVIADGSNYVISSVAISTAETVAADIVSDLAARHVLPTAGPLDLRFASRYNPSMDGQPHSITMMLGLIVYQVALIISAQSFTRERELGTMEQLRVTPLGRLELIVGKALPVLLIGLADCLLMTGIIIAWFDVPMRGSILLLLILTIPFVLTQIGWGTLISLISRTQQQAMMFVFALAMVEIACSGFMVPASTMPPVMQFLSQFSSVQHYVGAVRGLMLRGAGLTSLWIPLLALSGIALGVILLALLRMRAGLSPDSLRRRLQTALQKRRRDREARRRDKARIPVPVLRPLAPSTIPSRTIKRVRRPRGKKRQL
jgi:ABC-2 type transport system permease protein